MNVEGGIILLLGLIFGVPLLLGALRLLNWIGGADVGAVVAADRAANCLAA